MWRLDTHGTPLDDADAAREELRRRAWLAVASGLRTGRDVRHHRVRVRDEDGTVVFEGTLAEAMASDAPCILPLLQGSQESQADVSRRLRFEAASNRQALLTARTRLGEAIAESRKQRRIAEQLVAASRIDLRRPRRDPAA